MGNEIPGVDFCFPIVWKGPRTIQAWICFYLYRKEKQIIWRFFMNVWVGLWGYRKICFCWLVRRFWCRIFRDCSWITEFFTLIRWACFCRIVFWGVVWEIWEGMRGSDRFWGLMIVICFCCGCLGIEMRRDWSLRVLFLLS
jgi:hypothetical protein